MSFPLHVKIMLHQRNLTELSFKFIAIENVQIAKKNGVEKFRQTA